MGLKQLINDLAKEKVGAGCKYNIATDPCRECAMSTDCIQARIEIENFYEALCARKGATNGIKTTEDKA